MSYTIEKINVEIEESFVKKYGVCIDGGTPQTATGLEALCHRVYNKGWADCREKMLNKMWIPCSERLPEERVDVLVSFGDEYPAIAWYSEINNHWKNSSTDIPISMDVTAWMPLPEPYMEQNNE